MGHGQVVPSLHRRSVEQRTLRLLWAKLAAYFVHIVIDRLARNLACLANNHSDALNREGATSRRQTGKISCMGASCNPLGSHLIPMHQAVGQVDLPVGKSGHTDALASHNSLRANKRKWV